MNTKKRNRFIEIAYVTLPKSPNQSNLKMQIKHKGVFIYLLKTNKQTKKRGRRKKHNQTSTTITRTKSSNMYNKY